MSFRPKWRNQYYIYIISSKSLTLYIGITSNLTRRIYEHRHGLIQGFSSKYHCNRLIYFEEYNDVNTAIAREKQLKKWRREKKLWLVQKMNPYFKDLIE